MAFVSWDPKLLIGIDFVDRDHKGLFDLVNRLHAAMTEQRGREVVGGILKELHATFVGKIDELTTKCNAGNNLVSIDLLKFLKNWLVSHIAEDDKLYRAFLEKTAALSPSGA
nr:hypothetical protein [uncultured Holophaga sp.]